MRYSGTCCHAQKCMKRRNRVDQWSMVNIKLIKISESEIKFDLMVHGKQAHKSQKSANANRPTVCTNTTVSKINTLTTQHSEWNKKLNWKLQKHKHTAIIKANIASDSECYTLFTWWDWLNEPVVVKLLWQALVKHTSSWLKCIDCKGIAHQAFINHTSSTHQCLINARPKSLMSAW